MTDLYDELDEGDKIDRGRMKREAIRRMKKLGLNEECIEKFKKGKLQMSLQGFLFDLSPDIKKMVEEHEKELGYIIYHVIHSYSNIGETYECLFVSNYANDWIYERDMIKNNIVYAWVINKTFPENSEAGSIMVQKLYGGLIRTA